MTTLFLAKKLTKSFFMELSDGVFLVCSCGMSPLEPSFAEYVLPFAQRGEQWLRIKEARVDQRHCDVYEKKEDFEEFLKGWRQRSDGRGWYRIEAYPNGL